MPDIAEQIDAAIGTAPPGAPALEPTLALGRRALRRRRLAYGVGTVATALVVGGTAWAVSPDDTSPSRSRDPGFGGEPSTSGSASALADEERPQDAPGSSSAPWVGPDAARLAAPGRVEVKPGWTVTEDMSRAGRWWAVEIAKGDRLQWFLFGDAMTIVNAHAPALGYDSFRQWVDVNVPLLDDQGANDGQDQEWPGVPRDDLVHFAPPKVSITSGLLPAREGVVVVKERYDVDLGVSFAPPEKTIVAQVREDGETWYVVARRPDDYIAVPGSVAKTDHGIDDLDEFIAFARDRYAEDGGGLL